MGRRSKISEKLIHAICEKIKEGAFAHVAAEASGVSKATFYRWLDYAEQGRGGLFAQFRDECRLARAEARANAESRVFEGAPFQWLRYGPGRDRGPDDPGWTEKSSVELDAHMEYAGCEIPCPASLETLAAGMAELEAIGLDVFHDRRLFRQLPASADNAEALPPPSGRNGDAASEHE